MATSVLQYAQLANVKTRIGITDTSSDTVLQNLCNQVNGEVERITGRVLGPYPLFSTTLNGNVSAGATSAVLTSATGLNVGDAIMFGPVTGTHEHAYVQAISSNTITLQTALVSAYGSGAAVERVHLFDGFWQPDGNVYDDGRTLLVPTGIVSLTSVEVTTYTGGPWYLIPASDWFLRPSARELDPGWPFMWVEMTNIPSAGNTTPMFYPGRDTVRLRGQMGFPAIPDEIVTVAEILVTNLYRTKGGAGANDQVSIGIEGERLLAETLASEEARVLALFERDEMFIV